MPVVAGTIQNRGEDRHEEQHQNQKISQRPVELAQSSEQTCTESLTTFSEPTM